jgi:hypothetical protein
MDFSLLGCYTFVASTWLLGACLLVVRELCVGVGISTLGTLVIEPTSCVLFEYVWLMLACTHNVLPMVCFGRTVHLGCVSDGSCRSTVRMVMMLVNRTLVGLSDFIHGRVLVYQVYKLLFLLDCSLLLLVSWLLCPRVSSAVDLVLFYQSRLLL